MSDLQCPATVLVARHGEAEYETDLLTDAGGSLTLTGRSQARALGDALADRNVASVYCSPLARAVQTAEIAAARLGCGVRVRNGLAEISVGDYAGRRWSAELIGPVFDRWRLGDLSAAVPGAEDGAQTVARVSDTLNEVADLHRGETVLVVSHAGVMTLVLPRLAVNLVDDHAFDLPVPNCLVAELSVDADGWRCTTWPSGR